MSRYHGRVRIALLGRRPRTAPDIAREVGFRPFV